MKKIGIGLLGLGTVGQGVATIINNPNDRHPLVEELELVGIAVKNLQKKKRNILTRFYPYYKPIRDSQ